MLAAPLAFALSALSSAAPSAQLVPASARPGDAFVLLIRGADTAPRAEVAGRGLPFFPVKGGWAAVAALPVETAPGALAIPVLLDGAPPLTARLTVSRARFPRRALQLDEKFVKPPPPDVQARIEADRAAIGHALDRPAAPPLFTGPFGWPREDKVTARYGERRTLNGVKPSQHYGVDMAGAEGAPVQASNAGEVVLVRDCWASGVTVILWHGAGLFTTYLHLSRALVAEGDRVERGQPVGLVGQTGRSSGPHLHWGVRVRDLYVDPESVLRLDVAALAP